jgi:hypothetical protein
MTRQVGSLAAFPGTPRRSFTYLIPELASFFLGFTPARIIRAGVGLLPWIVSRYCGWPMIKAESSFGLLPEHQVTCMGRSLVFHIA